MTNNYTNFHKQSTDYLELLNKCFTVEALNSIELLAKDLHEAWIKKRQVFICGNGGSAANALHIANDLHYGIGLHEKKPKIAGIRVEALSSNVGIVTCLANDTGYENIYSNQLKVKANPDDLLIALSGSGESSNIVNALLEAKELRMKSHAILAFKGGSCIKIADNSIHIKAKDMQIAEDSQLIIGHLCMQWLQNNQPINFI